MPLSQIRKTAVRKMNELMTSERVMKLLGDPRVQKAMMGTLKFQANARDRWEKGVGVVAGSFSLVTRKDLNQLKRRIRDLEGQLRKIQKADGKKT